MELVPLPWRQELFHQGYPMQDVYFLEGGVVSIVVVMEDGGSVEAATVGYEGFAGVPGFLGEDRAHAQYIVQGTGTARTMPVAAFRAAVEQLPALRAACNRYTSGLMQFMAQTTACNRLHPVEARCARWLLLMHDRMRADRFPLTQEFLAQMLGVRRPSVTAAAVALQRDAIISYSRGRMTIVSRGALERAACECYSVIQGAFGNGKRSP